MRTVTTIGLDTDTIAIRLRDRYGPTATFCTAKDSATFRRWPDYEIRHRSPLFDRDILPHIAASIISFWVGANGDQYRKAEIYFRAWRRGGLAARCAGAASEVVQRIGLLQSTSETHPRARSSLLPLMRNSKSSVGWTASNADRVLLWRG